MQHENLPTIPVLAIETMLLFVTSPFSMIFGIDYTLSWPMQIHVSPSPKLACIQLQMEIIGVYYEHKDNNHGKIPSHDSLGIPDALCIGTVGCIFFE